MFKNFFLSELKYTLKQPMPYIFMGLMALFTFGATVSDNIQIGGAVGNVYKNAPHIITIYTTIMTIFGLLIATAFFNNAALRDYKNGFHEILFSTPLKKSGYFFGRFSGALVLATIPMLGVFLGVIIGSFLGPAFNWIDADRIGDFYLETFLNNYFIFVLPNMFFAGSIIFALSNKWKSTIISFVGTLAIIVGYIIAGTLLSDIDNENLAALTDSFGIRAYSIYAKYYTPIEKNTLSPGLTGLLVLNRIIWLGVGCIILLASYFTFSFKEKARKVKAIKNDLKKSTTHFTLPALTLSYSAGTEWMQFKSFFKTNLLSITKSVTFRILFVFSAVMLITNLTGGFEYYGLKAYPLTYKMIDTINDASSIFVVIILVFFSGELIWRDRDSKINEVIDATPHTSLISLCAKALSLVSITTLLHLFFVLVGVLYQLGQGYTRIELMLYLQYFLLSNLPIYITWSGVMIMIQVLINHKYIGYFISILVIFGWEITLSMLDIDTNMLSLGSAPSIRYSDMNAFGPGLYGNIIFRIYWLLFAFICLLTAGALWNRGAAGPLKERIKAARKQVPRTYRTVILGLTFSWLVVAGYVYYNTQILNTYRTPDESERITAEYEKEYSKYAQVPLPKIKDIKYFIDLYPHERNAQVKAQILLQNTTNQNIDSLHYTLDDHWKAEFNIPNAQLVWEDKERGYLIYKLAQPIAPQATLPIEITTQFTSVGFENEPNTRGVLKNGTFLNNMQILPYMGYNANQELSEKNIRKKYGLTPKDRMPELETTCTGSCMKNYLSEGLSDFINVETIISTSEDQMAIAPGSLIKQWNKDGRNYYHHKVDHPSQNFYSFISARFEVKTRKWKDVNLEVYYDHKHPENVDMMLDAIERSLEYYTTHFGPYMHKQCRIIEFPRYASFAQAFPGTMPYSEALGFTTNLQDETENNIVDAIVAHEMAHQWWAHQVIGAHMQGATMFSESFAEYSSLMTMKKLNNDPMKMRDFLKYNHNRYLRGRSRETHREVPLYKVENQPHIHYGKGSIVLYALQDYIGEDKVNKAMRNFLNEHKYKDPPYPTSLDFIQHLEREVPDSMQYLITDWFKEITLYDNRLKKAQYEKTDTDHYRVTLNIECAKLRADTIGNETKVALNDWIDIGLFSDDEEKTLLAQKRIKITQPKTEVIFEVDELPAKAAIDPKRLLIDRVYSDNTKSIHPIEE